MCGWESTHLGGKYTITGLRRSAADAQKLPRTRTVLLEMCGTLGDHESTALRRSPAKYAPQLVLFSAHHQPRVFGMKCMAPCCNAMPAGGRAHHRASCADARAASCPTRCGYTHKVCVTAYIWDITTTFHALPVMGSACMRLRADYTLVWTSSAGQYAHVGALRWV